MISIRQSTATTANKALKEVKAKPGETNTAWLKRAGARPGLLLLGGASAAHFRIRVAQSHARADQQPSCWSLAGIFTDQKTMLSVPLELSGDASETAKNNGVQECDITDYDDPERFPNVALINFTKESNKILGYAWKVAEQRSIIDLPTLMLPWLAYIWISGKASNPLADGLGLPSAAFVETAYGIGGIELTPGLASATSCPEAIWQAAKWWHDFYKTSAKTAQDAAPQVPNGSYVIRQPAAAAVWSPSTRKTEASVKTAKRARPAQRGRK